MVQASKSSDRSKRNAATKLAEHRLSVLELAKELGNVAEACQRRPRDGTGGHLPQGHSGQTHRRRRDRDLG
jgi:hypothetical protein